MVNNMTKEIFRMNLPVIRFIFGLSGEKLCKLLDISRQTLVNIENGRGSFTTAMYFAMRFVFDSMAAEATPEMRSRYEQLLQEKSNTKIIGPARKRYEAPTVEEP